MSNRWRLFFATDIHGSERCFRKFVNAAKFYRANVVILGGDITGKMIVPLVDIGGGYFQTAFLGRTQTLPISQLPDIEKQVSYVGFYPYRTTPDELAELQHRAGSVDALFRQVIQDTLSRWLDLAEDRLRPLGVRCILQPGNDDDPVVDEILQSSPFVENSDARVLPLADDWDLVSLGFANITPFESPRELPEDVLKARLAQLLTQVRSPQRTIVNVHVPPRETLLDQAPLLNPDLSPVMEGGHIKVGGVGSSAVREVLAQFRPPLSLHGHIHESRAAQRLGPTIAVNPGSEYGEGVLLGAVIDLTDKGVQDVQLTSG